MVLLISSTEFNDGHASYSGDLLQLGAATVFRFNNPEEALKMRNMHNVSWKVDVEDSTNTSFSQGAIHSFPMPCHSVTFENLHLSFNKHLTLIKNTVVCLH